MSSCQTHYFFFEVLEVRADKRIGKLSLYTCMRKVLEEHYGTQPVGLGGTFLLKTGKAKVHVMVGRTIVAICFNVISIL